MQRNSPGGSTRRPVVLRPVRATPCYNSRSNYTVYTDAPRFTQNDFVNMMIYTITCIGVGYKYSPD